MGRCGRMALALAVALAAIAPARRAAAQLSEPCSAACGLVLGATAFTTATGTAVAIGRYTGGISTVSHGLWIWGVSFAAVAGGGLALGGNGERQERAVYAAGIGAVAGSLVWLGVESSLDRSTGARKLAASLVGAAAGAVIGGVYGVLTHDPAEGSPTPVFAVRLRF